MNYSISKTISNLRKRFEYFKFDYKTMDMGSSIPIFFVHNESHQELEQNWTKIADFIAIDFQTKLTQEYQIWNIYILYITANGLSRELKYKIENDTFSSRKIVIEGHMDHDLMIKNSIQNYISIEPENFQESDSKFIPNTIIEDLLKNKVLKRKNITKQAHTAYIDLVKILKQDSNEV